MHKVVQAAQIGTVHQKAMMPEELGGRYVYIYLIVAHWYDIRLHPAKGGSAKGTIINKDTKRKLSAMT